MNHEIVHLGILTNHNWRLKVLAYFFVAAGKTFANKSMSQGSVNVISSRQLYFELRGHLREANDGLSARSKSFQSKFTFSASRLTIELWSV